MGLRIVQSQMRPAPGRLIVVAIVIASIALAAIGACTRHVGGPKGPRLAVLGSASDRSDVWTVEPKRGTVERHAVLRSLAVASDPASNGALVTAQCGGLGADGDRRIGIVPAQGSTRYVDLGAPNPSDVSVAAGHAVVLHGFATNEGMWISSVDLTSGSVVATSAVEGSPQRLTAVGGRVFLTVGRGDDRGLDVVEIDPSTLRTRIVVTLPLESGEVARDWSSAFSNLTVVGFGSSDAAAATSAAFGIDAGARRVLWRRDLRGARVGAFSASTDGRTLAVLDAAPGDPTAEDAVILLDARDGHQAARISGGSPVAVAVYDGTVAVADARAGALHLYDARARALRSIALGPLGEVAHLDVIR